MSERLVYTHIYIHVRAIVRHRVASIAVPSERLRAVLRRVFHPVGFIMLQLIIKGYAGERKHARPPAPLLTVMNRRINDNRVYRD